MKNKAEQSDLLRYFNGEMKGRERNAFERRLHRDLFSGEAAEGFAEITGAQLSSDLEQLDERLRVRASHKTFFTFYRIAATVTVLLVISSVFIILSRKVRTEELIPAAAAKSVTLEIAESRPLTENQSLITTDQNQVVRSADSLTEVIAKAAIPEQDTIGAVQEYVAESINADTLENSISVVADERPAELLAAREKAEVAPVSAAGAPAGSSLKKAAMARYQENEIITTDSRISPVEEIVTLGYGQSQKAAVFSGTYTAPAPANGKPAFEDYIISNIRKPASLSDGESVIVILSLLVRSTGSIDTINIISSPGKEFSDEASRLIKEGPSWLPAENNGTRIDDEIRVRIIFRK